MRKGNLGRATLSCSLLLVVACIGVSARNLDCTLGLIARPISTVPTIVKAGDAFDVTLATDKPIEELSILLYQGPERTVVFTHSSQQPPLQPKQGLLTVQATAPANVKPGLCGLSAYVRGKAGRSGDTSERAVKVVAEWPRSYSFAHVTDVHIGRQDPPFRDEVFKRTASEINRIGVDFVLITGDLTDNGTPEQYRRFLEILDSFDAPTFVAAGNHDRGEGAEFGSPNNIYERYCGPGNYTFDIGSHRYICTDTRWTPEFLGYPAYRAWLEEQLKRPNPSFGVVLSHRISEAEYPYFQEELPAHNYRVFVYGHTHDDVMSWIGPKRLMLLNTSQELLGTYNIVKIENDQVAVIDHHHRAAMD